MSYIGDFVAGVTLITKGFTTRAFATGIPTVLAGTPAVEIYKDDDGASPSQAGVSLAVDVGQTGRNVVSIDTSADGTFYAAAHDFHIVVKTGTVGGVSVVGEEVGHFSIENRSEAALASELAKVPKSDGSVIFNATCVGNIKSGLSTQAELDKVPKSDGAVTWNATALGDIQTQAEDALVVHRLDELLNADSDIDGAAPPTVGSVFHELMTKTAGSFTYDQTTDSAEALRDRGDSAWVTATGFSTFDPTTDPVLLADGAHGGAAAVLTLKQLALNNGDAGGVAFRVQGTGTGNSHGVHISSVNGKGWVVDAASDAVAFNSSAARGLVSEGPTGDIVGDLTGTLARVTLCDTTTTNSDMRGTDGANTTVPPAAGAIADQVWEEAIADHSGTAGSTAASLAAAGGAGDPWLTPIPGLYLPGTAGAILGTNIDAAISTRTKPADTQARVTLVDTCTTNTDMRGTDGANTTVPPTAIENADALLDRNMATGADNGSSTVRTVRQALRFLRNKWSVAAGTLTVAKENDVDASWTATLTTDAAADPVTGSDPAGP